MEDASKPNSLVAVTNLREFFQYYRFIRLRKSALLTWTGPRPPLYRLFLWVGAVLAILVFYKLVILQLHPKYVFGETMMLVYYVYALPLGVKIKRGFYEEGIWTEGGFVPYVNIGALPPLLRPAARAVDSRYPISDIRYPKIGYRLSVIGYRLSGHTSSRSSCAPRSSVLPVKWMSCAAILSRSRRRAAP
jgi:hypothetical protein